MPERRLRDLLQAFVGRHESEPASPAAPPGLGDDVQQVAHWRGRMQGNGLLRRLTSTRGPDRVAAVDELLHLHAPIDRVGRLRATRQRVRVGDQVVVERVVSSDDDDVVMHRPRRAGLFEVHNELLDARGGRVLASEGDAAFLQVIGRSPTFAVDVALVLARPSAAPVLWALRREGGELFYFDVAERDRTIELRHELDQHGAPPAAILVHAKDATEVPTLGVDFRSVFLTATLRRLRGEGVPVAGVVSDDPTAAVAAVRTGVDHFEELNPARRALAGYLRDATQPSRSCAGRLDRMTLTQAVDGNACHIELDNRRARQRLFAAIDAARRTLHLQYYLVRDGPFSDRLAARLIRAARRGVRVRLLVDALYSVDGVAGATNAVARGLTAEPGVEVVSIKPIVSRDDLDPLVLKQRDHRKLVVVDGRLAFVGGRNAADEYYTGFDEVAITDWTPHARIPWLDAHAEVRGPLVGAIERAFVTRWIEVGGRPPRGGVSSIGDPAPEGSSRARLVLHEGVDDAAAMLAYEAIIDGARDHIWIVNDFPIVPSLQLALRRALSRGTQVRLLTGCAVPRRDDDSFFDGPLHREAFEYMTKKRLEPLLRAGLQAWEHVVAPHPLIVCRGGTVRPYVHAKVVTADGEIASVGSANLDATASYWEREANVVIEDPAVAGALEVQLGQMSARGRPLEIGSARWQRESLLRDLASQLWPESLYS